VDGAHRPATARALTLARDPRFLLGFGGAPVVELVAGLEATALGMSVSALGDPPVAFAVRLPLRGRFALRCVLELRRLLVG